MVGKGKSERKGRKGQSKDRKIQNGGNDREGAKSSLRKAHYL
jgi:hypothetical protein